jgi:hypothetical protein
VFTVLVIEHAKRMHLIVLSSVVFSRCPKFQTFAHERYDFRKNAIERKMRVLVFVHLLSEIFLSPKRIQRDVIINVRMSLRKVPVTPVRF